MRVRLWVFVCGLALGLLGRLLLTGDIAQPADLGPPAPNALAPEEEQ